MTLARAYFAAAAGFIVFAVWGSLFPFVFNQIPIDVALDWFLATWRTEAVNLSLTDLVSNVLLFVPIGLFLTAALEHRQPPASRTQLAIVVLLASAALSLSVEIGQAFVPQRTPSIVDVIAEVVGTAIGIALWRAAATELDSLARSAWHVVQRASQVERLLMVYGVVFAGLWLLPYDFTIRPAEIGDKYQHGRLLLPFTVAIDAATPAELALTLASAVPLGVGAALVGGGRTARRSVARATTIAAGVLVLLELGQVPVFSRTTDATELLAAVVGAIGGAVVAAAMTHRPDVWTLERSALNMVMPVAAWSVAAVVAEWWPLQFAFDPERARLETQAWARAPFRAPHGLFDVLSGALLACTAGVWLGSRLSREFTRLQIMLVIVAAGAVFTTFEVGRVLLIGGRPTLVGPLVKVAATLAGVIFVTGPATLVGEGAQSAD